jgi:hypothetical protein
MVKCNLQKSKGANILGRRVYYSIKYWYFLGLFSWGKTSKKKLFQLL